MIYYVRDSNQEIAIFEIGMFSGINFIIIKIVVLKVKVKSNSKQIF